eukprot:TRINITY_DN21387_c0_g1_i2.p1 TRINITY_DN21387_c0_g1~~TRINITY_DN21387_c0_g1_i2.p1  ORF type:complete len:896 (+),score=28.80 TRINITY_DN21387_c0_g1_i2:83-2689(+)
MHDVRDAQVWSAGRAASPDSDTHLLSDATSTAPSDDPRGESVSGVAATVALPASRVTSYCTTVGGMQTLGRAPPAAPGAGAVARRQRAATGVARPILPTPSPADGLLYSRQRTAPAAVGRLQSYRGGDRPCGAHTPAASPLVLPQTAEEDELRGAALLIQAAGRGCRERRRLQLRRRRSSATKIQAASRGWAARQVGLGELAARARDDRGPLLTAGPGVLGPTESDLAAGCVGGPTHAAMAAYFRRASPCPESGGGHRAAPQPPRLLQRSPSPCPPRPTGSGSLAPRSSSALRRSVPGLEVGTPLDLTPVCSVSPPRAPSAGRRGVLFSPPPVPSVWGDAAAGAPAAAACGFPTAGPRLSSPLPVPSAGLRLPGPTYVTPCEQSEAASTAAPQHQMRWLTPPPPFAHPNAAHPGGQRLYPCGAHCRDAPRPVVRFAPQHQPPFAAPPFLEHGADGAVVIHAAPASAAGTPPQPPPSPPAGPYWSRQASPSPPCIAAPVVADGPAAGRPLADSAPLRKSTGLHRPALLATQPAARTSEPCSSPPPERKRPHAQTQHAAGTDAPLLPPPLPVDAMSPRRPPPDAGRSPLLPQRSCSGATEPPERMSTSASQALRAGGMRRVVTIDVGSPPHSQSAVSLSPPQAQSPPRRPSAATAHSSSRDSADVAPALAPTAPPGAAAPAAAPPSAALEHPGRQHSTDPGRGTHLAPPPVAPPTAPPAAAHQPVAAHPPAGARGPAKAPPISPRRAQGDQDRGRARHRPSTPQRGVGSPARPVGPGVPTSAKLSYQPWHSGSPGGLGTPNHSSPAPLTPPRSPAGDSRMRAPPPQQLSGQSGVKSQRRPESGGEKRPGSLPLSPRPKCPGAPASQSRVP